MRTTFSGNYFETNLETGETYRAWICRKAGSYTVSYGVITFRMIFDDFGNLV